MTRTLSIALAFSIVIIMFSPVTTQAQESYGFIHIECSQPVEVFIDDVHFGTTTQELGGMLIKDVPTGKHTVTLRKDGYKPYSKQLRVTKSSLSEVKINQLEPQKTKVGQIASLGSSMSQLFNENKYTTVIKLLKKKASEDTCQNTILFYYSRALLKKCQRMKENNNSEYQKLVYKPFEIGKRMIRKNRQSHTGYYIIAKSLLVNEDPAQGCEYIEKALHYKPDNYSYQKLKGKLYLERASMLHDKDRALHYLKTSKSAYKQCLGLCQSKTKKQATVQNALDTVQKKIRRLDKYR